MSDRIDALKALHTSLVDSRNGYDEAVKQSNGEGLEPLFRSMIELRDAASSELAQQLTSLGETPDADGSFMSTVHRTVIDIRSYVTGLDASVLPSLISGEERILASYDDALAKSAAGNPEHAALVEQRAKLIAKIDQMKRMNAKAAA
ncbi:MAG: ferritin-like domain-containing protein [Hyphomicrobium sp.]